MSQLKDDSTPFFSGQTCLTSYSGNTHTRGRQSDNTKNWRRALFFFSFWTFLLAPSLPFSLLTKLAVCACSNSYILCPFRVLLCSFLCFFVFQPCCLSHDVLEGVEGFFFTLPHCTTRYCVSRAGWTGISFVLFFLFPSVYFILLTRNFFLPFQPKHVPR